MVTALSPIKVHQHDLTRPISPPAWLTNATSPPPIDEQALDTSECHTGLEMTREAYLQKLYVGMTNTRKCKKSKKARKPVKAKKAKRGGKKGKTTVAADKTMAARMAKHATSTDKAVSGDTSTATDPNTDSQSNVHTHRSVKRPHNRRDKTYTDDRFTHRWDADGGITTVHGDYLSPSDLYLAYRTYATNHTERGGDGEQVLIPKAFGVHTKKIRYHAVWMCIAYSKFGGSMFSHNDIKAEFAKQMAVVKKRPEKKNATFPIQDFIDGRYVTPMVIPVHYTGKIGSKRVRAYEQVRLHPTLVQMLDARASTGI